MFIRLNPFGLLRGQIMNGANNIPCMGHRRGRDSPGNTEIRDLRTSIRSYKYVMGFNIPMDYVVFMSMTDCPGDLQR
ncbi:hypothetical protein SDC9_183245 [bioreactor metagenome]|uniref:Uncharacterized protein n=1 Tax=bioreactor metagenome TaxID=1076179 RepID=A0A645HB55_9ZZZZ